MATRSFRLERSAVRSSRIAFVSTAVGQPRRRSNGVRIPTSITRAPCHTSRTVPRSRSPVTWLSSRSFSTTSRSRPTVSVPAVCTVARRKRRTIPLAWIESATSWRRTPRPRASHRSNHHRLFSSSCFVSCYSSKCRSFDLCSTDLSLLLSRSFALPIKL